MRLGWGSLMVKLVSGDAKKKRVIRQAPTKGE
jgi:hypothetical protein